MDDVKSSHEDPKVNIKFAEWCEKKHGSNKGVPQVKMKTYVENMTKEFPCEISSNNAPWNNNLFKIDDNSPFLLKMTQKYFTLLQ